MKRLISNMPTIVCLICAAVILCSDRDGWGWFLLIALFFYNND